MAACDRSAPRAPRTLRMAARASSASLWRSNWPLDLSKPKSLPWPARLCWCSNWPLEPISASDCQLELARLRWVGTNMPCSVGLAGALDRGCVCLRFALNPCLNSWTFQTWICSDSAQLYKIIYIYIFFLCISSLEVSCGVRGLGFALLHGFRAELAKTRETLDRNPRVKTRGARN